MNTLFLGLDKLPPYTDGQIVELSYQNNVLKLTLKNYKEEIATYSFLNIFQLSFENYLNEDIDEIRTFWEERDGEKVCRISLTTRQKLINIDFKIVNSRN